MTESEVIEALSEISMNAATYLTIFISVTFAYLTVAYLVGSSLTRFQAFMASALYLLTSIMTGTATVGFTDTWQKLHAREQSVFNDVWLYQNTEWLVMLLPALTLVVLASLYFMFDIRRRGIT